jgi:hypothetical protein
MKETNNKNSCCSGIIKYFCAAQKSSLLFCAAHWNKQKYFDAFSLLWDDTKRSNCPGRVGFSKARYMKSFPFLHTNSLHSILCKIGYVIQIVVHQFVRKTSAEKKSLVCKK